MGFVYDELIPAAVLFNNPGITKEEFVLLLSDIKVSTRNYSKYARWDTHSKCVTEKKFGTGLMRFYCLAHLLSLSESEQFKQFQEVKRDEHKLWICPPMLDDYLHDVLGFRLRIHYRNQVREEKYFTDFSYNELEVWDGSGNPDYKHVWFNAFTNRPIGIVRKILLQTEFPYDSYEQYEMINPDQNFYASDAPRFLYSCYVLPFKAIEEIKKFDTLENVVSEFPQFHPDFRYDWQQTEGGFHGWGTDLFFWKQENGKYYFDEKTLDFIPASFRCDSKPKMQFGYTDLILTGEAIKKKAWKLFSYGGTQHTDYFLKLHKDSSEKFECAIWNSHTSLYAKEKSMTTKEFLRMRLLKEL